MPPVGFEPTNLSRRVAADLRLRPRGYWDRLLSTVVPKITGFNKSLKLMKIFPLPNFMKVCNSTDTVGRYTTVYYGKCKTATSFGYTKTAIFRPCVSYMQKKENYLHIIHTGCPGRNVPDFGRMFLKLKYTDITQNTYIQS